MTPNDIIAWARSMQGFPAVARDGADAKTDLLLVSEAIHEIAGELPIKGDRIEMDLIDGVRDYKLPRDLAAFGRVYVDGIDITSQQLPSEQLSLESNDA